LPPPSLDTLRLQILRRCQGLLLSRSAWPTLLVYLDAIDQAEWRKNGLLIAWPASQWITRCTRLTRWRIEYAKGELQVIGLLIHLRHSSVGQPGIYRIDPAFVPPADYLRLLEGVPLAASLERDDEQIAGLGMLNELGRQSP
jgi:hypothetical protein